jgi:hypothetical protein
MAEDIQKSLFDLFHSFGMVKIHNSTKKSTNSGCQTIKTQASGGVWKTVNAAAFEAVDRFNIRLVGITTSLHFQRKMEN